MTPTETARNGTRPRGNDTYTIFMKMNTKDRLAASEIARARKWPPVAAHVHQCDEVEKGGDEEAHDLEHEQVAERQGNPEQGPAGMRLRRLQQRRVGDILQALQHALHLARRAPYREPKHLVTADGDQQGQDDARPGIGPDALGNALEFEAERAMVQIRADHDDDRVRRDAPQPFDNPHSHSPEPDGCETADRGLAARLCAVPRTRSQAHLLRPLCADSAAILCALTSQSAIHFFASLAFI